MRKNALVVGLAVAVLGTAGPVNATPPADACGLLKSAEIQALAGSAKVGDGVAGTHALGSGSCQYKWGAGGNQSILTVILTETSRAFPGMAPSMVKQGLLAGAKPGDPNATVISGVGDAALYQSDDPIRVKTTAIAKGIMLSVNVESSDARARKDQVIALLKIAAGRL